MKQQGIHQFSCGLYSYKYCLILKRDCPFYLRPTTRKCLHLVTRGHFWSRDKDGGRTIQSAVSENPMLHANFVALCFIKLELLPIEVLHCRNRDFRSFFLLWPWPWFDDLYIRAWPIFARDTPDVRKWTSYDKAFECYRLTDRQTDRDDQNYIPRRFAGGQ